MVFSFGVTQSRDNFTSMGSNYEMVGMEKNGGEAWHSHNQESISSVCKVSGLVKGSGLCVATRNGGPDCNYLGFKGGRSQEASGLLRYTYNHMNLILKLLTISPGVGEKEVASEMLYRELSLNVIYVHCIYECHHLS